MKKLLMSGVVAVLCSGAPAVYADDAHHPDQAGAPAAKAAPGKTAPAGKKPAASKKPVGDAACCIADEQMGKAQERMKQALALMVKLREAKDPAERQRLMQEHTQAMRDTMDMMHGMKMGSGMGMMGSGQGCGGQGMGMMGQCKGQAGGMMNMHQMMEARMEMMQMMMEQMFERQEMLMRDGK